MPAQQTPRGRSGGRPGGDGKLTHALDPHDVGPQDACGVFGVWAPGEDRLRFAAGIQFEMSFAS